MSRSDGIVGGFGEACVFVYKAGLSKREEKSIICLLHSYVPHSDRLLRSLLVTAQKFAS